MNPLSYEPKMFHGHISLYERHLSYNYLTLVPTVCARYMPFSKGHMLKFVSATAVTFCDFCCCCC